MGPIVLGKLNLPLDHDDNFYHTLQLKQDITTQHFIITYLAFKTNYRKTYVLPYLKAHVRVAKFPTSIKARLKLNFQTTYKVSTNINAWWKDMFTKKCSKEPSPDFCCLHVWLRYSECQHGTGVSMICMAP